MERLNTSQRDFNAPTPKTRPSGWSRHRYQLLTLAGLLLGGIIIFILLADDAEATRAVLPILEPEALENTDSPLEDFAGVAEPTNSTQLTDTNPRTSPSAPVADKNWVRAEVRKNDNLSLIFARHGLGERDLHQIMSSDKAAQALKKIHPGDEIRLLIDADGTLRALAYDFSEANTLNIVRTNDTYTTSIIDRPLETRIAQASGVIRDSLFLSANRAGLSDALIMQLVQIFGWDIDFALDIRQNDRFSLIYEEVYLDGKKRRDGRILAAEFINRDRTYHAIQNIDAQGRAEYYSPDGKSMRKAFLRTPVEFSRVSSGFSVGRMHPVLNRIRAHKGVDYAAPTGTPIKSTGDGRIILKGVHGGYGNTVIIQHGSRYSTLYAHMSSFNPKLKQGDRVSQGQVIGYVGMSGLATGPHLHYEFRVDDVHRDPLKVPLPNAAPIDNRHMPAFLAKAKPLLARLSAMESELATTKSTPTGQIALSSPR
ncbi:MAG: peptidoglycan DD-metalloendopeptidase family protein [Chromatiales bacterium]|jgi:murein DD-endopeptidase MepM/ murein hydrolase activator NlpD|nr:peptidoglycan DD-metalloendopeptidase family protein [Chromatiales bacterium]